MHPVEGMRLERLPGIGGGENARVLGQENLRRVAPACAAFLLRPGNRGFAQADGADKMSVWRIPVWNAIKSAGISRSDWRRCRKRSAVADLTKWVHHCEDLPRRVFGASPQII